MEVSPSGATFILVVPVPWVFGGSLKFDTKISLGLSFPPDGKSFGTNGTPQGFWSWDAGSGGIVETSRKPVGRIARSTTRARLGPGDGETKTTLQGYTDWVAAVAVTPDARHVVSGSRYLP